MSIQKPEMARKMPKIFRKTQETITYWKPKNTTYRSINQARTRVLILDGQGWGSHSFPPSVTPQQVTIITVLQ